MTHSVVFANHLVISILDQILDVQQRVLIIKKKNHITHI